MKRVVLLLVAVFMAVQAAVSAGQEIVLRFSWWGGSERHENTLKAIELFEAANPGIRIKAEYAGWDGYVERLTTQMGANSEPDIMQINWAWIDMFSPDGKGLYDLNEVKDNINLDDFTPDMVASGLSGGALNGLPVSMTTRFWMWNKTHWDRVGLPIPRTWDDLANAGPVFREKLGADFWAADQEPIEALYMLDAYVYEKFGQQIIHETEPRVALTDAQLAEGFAYILKCHSNNSLVSAKVRSGVAGNYSTPAEQVAAWAEGKWNGTFIWDSMLDLRAKGPTEKNFELVLGPMLTIDGKNPKPDRIGRPAMMLAVSKNTRYPVEAAKFISYFLTTADAAGALKLARGVPVGKTAYKTVFDANLITPLNIGAQKQLEGSKRVYTSPLLEHERIRSLILDTIETVSQGVRTPEEAAEYLNREATRRIGRLARR